MATGLLKHHIRIASPRKECFSTTPLPLGPVCTPARASMWTGVYPSDHQVIDNVYGIDDVLTKALTGKAILFELMRLAGYETAHFGKWHLGEEQPEYFDVWQESFNSRVSHWIDQEVDGIYLPNLQTDRCVEYLLDPARADKPFIAVQGYYPPHDPYTAPKQFYEPYRGKGVPNAGYYAAVSALDHDLGRIIRALDDSGLRDQTIIIYFSDHGETFFYRPDGEHKFVCHEESIRIPFLMSCPNTIPSGARSNSMAGLQDLMPTVLDYAGVNIPDNLHGMSLKPLCQDPDRVDRDYFYVQNRTFHGEIEQRGLRTTQWKLIASADEKHSLFDLAMDPEEEFNLFCSPEDDIYRTRPKFPGQLPKMRELAQQMKNIAQELDDGRGVLLAENAIQASGER